MTGFPAGEKGPDGGYPLGSVDRSVEDRLRSFASILRKFDKQGGVEPSGERR